MGVHKHLSTSLLLRSYSPFYHLLSYTHIVIGIEGCENQEKADELHDWLALYGEITNRIHEENLKDDNPDAEKVGNGIFIIYP